MSLRRSVPAALSDSALASLATLVCGLYAARFLTLEQLGGYGVLFTATFALGSATITQLYFTPVEVHYVEARPQEQLAALPRSAAVGLGGATALSLLVTAIAVLVVPDLPWSSKVALAAGAAAVAALSPGQDHIRRVLHQAGRSPLAMGVSAVQLAVAAIAVAAMHAADVDPLWVPFTALATANLASSGAGLVLARHAARGAAHGPPAVRSVARMGGWLVMATQADQVGNFIGIALLGSIAGAAAVGEFEAARQLAQPLFVVATGLMAVLRPRVMTAAQQADERAARRFSGLYAALLGACGLGYAVVAGAQWPGNPLVDLFPNAYQEAWMLPSLSLATSLAFVIPMLGIQAISARREREMVRVNVSNQVVYVGAVGVLASPLGAMAMPAASVLNSVVLFARFRPLLRRIYVGGTPAAVPGAG